jgi:hypothetical protein
MCVFLPPYPYQAFTEESREVLKLTQKLAEDAGHGYIGTDHMLAGLASQSAGAAGLALRRLGMDTETVMKAADAIVAEHGGRESTPIQSPAERCPAQGHRRDLQRGRRGSSSGRRAGHRHPESAQVHVERERQAGTGEGCLSDPAATVSQAIGRSFAASSHHEGQCRCISHFHATWRLLVESEDRQKSL